MEVSFGCLHMSHYNRKFSLTLERNQISLSEAWVIIYKEISSPQKANKAEKEFR